MRNTQYNRRGKVLNLIKLPPDRALQGGQRALLSTNWRVQRVTVQKMLTEIRDRGAGREVQESSTLTSLVPPVPQKLGHGASQRKTKRTSLKASLSLSQSHSLGCECCTVIITIMPPQRGLWKALVATGAPSRSRMYRGEWASSGT